MEIRADTPQRKEAEEFDARNALSPIEHAATGSSVHVSLAGKPVLISEQPGENAMTIGDLFKADPKTALMPVGITTGGKGVEEIRASRNGRKIGVILTMFGPTGVLATMGKKIKVELEPCVLPDDNMIDKMTFSFLKDGEKVNANDLGIENWKVDDNLKEIVLGRDVSENGDLVVRVGQEKG